MMAGVLHSFTRTKKLKKYGWDRPHGSERHIRGHTMNIINWMALPEQELRRVLAISRTIRRRSIIYDDPPLVRAEIRTDEGF